MEKESIKVSVCIATYNGAKYIKQQMESILWQLSKDDEIIISDDGSIDDTLKVVQDFDDERIKVVVNRREHGYTSNFENALLHSSGDVIFLSDQDDVWDSNKLAIMVEDLKNADMVISDAKVVDSNLNVIFDSFWEYSSPSRSFLGNIYRFSYLGCCMAFKRAVLDKALPFPNNHKMATHDNWLCLVGLFFFRVHFENRPLLLYRRHQSNTSEGKLAKSKNSILYMMSYRLYVLLNILRRNFGL